MFKKPLIEALSKNSELYHFFQELHDAIPNPVYYKDEKGIYLGCNQAFALLVGLPEEKIAGKREHDIWPHEFAEACQKKDQELFNCPGVQVFESRIARPDGSVLDVVFNKATYRDIKGEISGLIGVITDISELKKMGDKLKKAAEDWRKTFDSISDGIFLVDKDNTIIKVNRAFARMHKAEPKSLLGLKCYALMHKMGKSWPECPLEKTKKDKLTHTEEVDDPNIGVVLSVTTSPILDENGELIGAVHVSRDITGQKKLEKELQKKIIDLERFQKITIGRELRMKELKAMVEELQQKSEA